MVKASLLGLLSGLAAALGVTVLLQQFSVLFPTGQITAGALALGAVVGTGAPALAHLVGERGHHGVPKSSTPVAHA